MRRPVPSLATVFALSAWTPAPAQQPAPVDWQSCRAQVLPGADELGWRAIPWLAELRDGVAAGVEQRKPVLLWAMNGHPLGCT